ncbi:DUF6600 domain-containing protein [Propionivibrio sp.]|uniref:DUF6600 domain-containing protein n=1 Tax=Propionivibrio sp. TaxID=2212460 RepID=UPI00260D2429|nr:DUF6600 domain-containing protein [Propionivibrio sp.]
MKDIAMHRLSFCSKLSILLAGIAALALSGWAAAEPPFRAARLSYTSGTVSFLPAGQSDWVQAIVNRPLTTGDGLWADANSRAEFQVGGAAIRLGSVTSVTLLNLDNHIAQMQLSQGTLKVRVRHVGPNQTFEVDTPNLAFTLNRPGEYRIDVAPVGDATVVMVQNGQAEVHAEGTSYTIDSKQGYRFHGQGLSDSALAAWHDDDLDRWALERDRRGDNSTSAQYVSSDVIGYEDLDSNGNWRADPNYGNVWTPTRVAAGWTPYRDGHWVWVDPWGWTWVDDAPWGFAVSHYGRWANIRGAWGWVPGPPREQAVYAPALVAFVGGKAFHKGSLPIRNTIGAVIGWFPLAPREVYRPSYPVSRSYFDNINRSNAVIAPTTINKVYNTTIVQKTQINVSKMVYVNQQVAGAVIAVPVQAFVQSQPVAKAAMPVSKETAASAPVENVGVVAPVQHSVHGGAPAVGAKPPTHERAVVVHTSPPPPSVAFAIQQQLAAKPGLPIDEVQRKKLKPATAPIPKVSVVTSSQALAPSALPPVTPPAAKSPEAWKAEAGKADTAKIEAARGAATKTDAAKVDAGKIEAEKAATVKNKALRVEEVKADAVKADAAKSEAAKAEAMRAETAKTEAAKAATAKAEIAKAQAAKAEAIKAESVKAEIAKAKAATAKAEASRADALKAESLKANAAKAAIAKAEAVRIEAVKAEEEKKKAEEARKHKPGAG